MIVRRVVSRTIDVGAGGGSGAARFAEGPIDASRVVGYAVQAEVMAGTWSSGVVELRGGVRPGSARMIPGRPTLTASAPAVAWINARDDAVIDAVVTTGESGVRLAVTVTVFLDEGLIPSVWRVPLDLTTVGTGPLRDDADNLLDYERCSLDLEVHSGGATTGAVALVGGAGLASAAALTPAAVIGADTGVRRGVDLSRLGAAELRVATADSAELVSVWVYATRGDGHRRPWHDRMAGLELAWPDAAPPEPHWPDADGAEVDIEAYDRVYAVHGVIHGTPSGAGLFLLPDRRGRSVRGMDDMGTAAGAAGAVTDAAADAAGGVAGAESVTLTTGQLPSHAHGYESHVGTTVTDLGMNTQAVAGQMSVTSKQSRTSASAGSGDAVTILNPTTFRHVFVIT